MEHIRIIGTGSYLPPKVLSNFDLAKILDTSDEWIRTRTGIVERRVADPDQAASDLAAPAAVRAMEMAQVGAEEIDLVLFATITPDTCCPAAACWLQDKIGAKRAVAFDVVAACTGFIYGLSVAEQYLKSGAARTVLLASSEVMTRIVDWTERESCILWGDGAGVVILRRQGGPAGLLSTHLYADGSMGKSLLLPGGGSRTTPISHDSVDKGVHLLRMQGQESYRIAVRAFVEVSEEALNHNGYTVKDVDLFIPHQANTRMIEAIAKRMGMPMERVYLTIHKYGNISSATIPIALDEAVRERRIKSGDLILLAAFGGGLTWGAAVVRW